MIRTTVLLLAQIINGSFEMGTGSAAGNIGLGTRCNSAGLCDGKLGGIQGWTVQGDVDYMGTYWKAQDGQRSLDLCGQFTGGVSQTFSTTPGSNYRVSFYLTANPDGGPKIKSTIVGAAGRSATFTFDTTGITHENMQWTLKTWTFRASEQQTTLSFRGTDLDYGAIIDNVSVELTTEPTCPECPTCPICPSYPPCPEVGNQVSIFLSALVVDRRIVIGPFPEPWVIEAGQASAPKSPLLVLFEGRLLTELQYSAIRDAETGKWQVRISDATVVIRAGLGAEILLIYQAPGVVCPSCAECPPTPPVLETWIDQYEIHCPADRCLAMGIETTFVPRGAVEVYRDGLRQVSSIHYMETPAEYYPGANFGKRRFTFARPFISGEVIELRYPIQCVAWVRLS